MTEELYIGVDLGTTAAKVGVFDDRGTARAVTSREFQLDSPQPGFLEFDADAYIDLAFESIRELVGRDDIDAASVRGIGMSSQGETFVVVDEAGRPLHPAISWLDVRAGEEAKALSEISEGRGGPEVDAILSGPKLLWLRRHKPDLMAKARRVMVINDYFIFRLTGRAASDPVTAISTGLYDTGSGRWINGLLEACGLNEAMMPDVLWPGEPAGTLTADAARDLGLPQTVPVAVGSNDQTVGAVGAGNVVPGCASITFGTALAIILTTPGPDNVPKGIFPALHAAKGLHTLIAYAKTAGIVLRWFRDNFAPGLSYDELFKEIALVPVGSGGVICIPHFSGSASPHFNPDVRGAFSGLTLGHGRAHLARAVVESLIFTIRENLDLLRETGAELKQLRAIGGGAQSDIWMQMVADATGVAVERPATSEAACLGAAEFAMVAAGRFGSVEEVSKALYRTERSFQPEPSAKAAYDEAFVRYMKLYQSLYG